MSFKYTLRKDDKGQEVARLQINIGATADGHFGPAQWKNIKKKRV